MNRRLIKEKTVCFTGHRSEKLPKGDALKHLRIKLSEEIEKAIQDGYNTFLFGEFHGFYHALQHFIPGAVQFMSNVDIRGGNGYSHSIHPAFQGLFNVTD